MNPFKGKSFALLLALLAEQSGAREALVFHERRWNFAQVKQEVDRASARLATLGVEKLDKVGLWLPNHPKTNKNKQNQQPPP